MFRRNFVLRLVFESHDRTLRRASRNQRLNCHPCQHQHRTELLILLVGMLFSCNDAQGGTTRLKRVSLNSDSRSLSGRTPMGKSAQDPFQRSMVNHVLPNNWNEGLWLSCCDADVNSIGQRYESQTTLWPPWRAASWRSVPSGRTMRPLPQLTGRTRGDGTTTTKILNVSSPPRPRIQ
jgi:hypothetical protein